jgi:anti-anti-sigma regulatory factor
MERAGGRLAVAGVGGQVKHLLALTHLDRVVEFYPNLTSARTALTDPARLPQA